jgi:uncharacterized protein (TIGR03067 family)
MNAVQILAVGLVMTAPALKEDPSDSPILGTWEIETMHVGGKKSKLRTTWEWEFRKDGQWIVRTEGKENKGERKYVVNTKTNPATIDLVAEIGNDPCAGVFRIEGDTLIVCVAPDNKGPRPVSVEVVNGSSHFFYTFKRVKK